MTAESEVTIIGAGLGGLTLARILEQGGVEVTVHDLDVSPTARAQGGMLDIHEDTGQAALRAAGLHELFLREVLPGGQATRILDRHAKVWLDETDDEDTGDRPEIQRETLRALLVGSLDEGTVRWGSRLLAVRPLDQGRHELSFADGTTTTTALLVGADGAWSRVRPLLSDARPVYSGMTFLTTRLHQADTQHPQAAATIGNGLLFALGDGKGFLAHREPRQDLEVYVAMETGPDWAAAQTDHQSTMDELSTIFEGWHEDLQRLYREADEPFVARPIHALPVGHDWERVPGVTLLGDAAHLMSPFAGEGANLAMADGAELGTALLTHGTATLARREKAVAEYESTLFPRSAAAAAESAENLAISFRSDAPAGLLAIMEGHLQAAAAPVTGASTPLA